MAEGQMRNKVQHIQLIQSPDTSGKEKKGKHKILYVDSLA
jgi:hypothetical protein